MNWLDIVVLVLWALVIAWGFWLGLLRILIPLAAVLLALVVASRGSHAIADLFSPFTNDDNVQNILAFVLVFLGIFVVGALIGHAVRKAIKFIPLFGLADRLAGAAVGILAGFVLLAGLLTAVQQFPQDGTSETAFESDFSRLLVDNFQVATEAVGIAPVDWDQEFGR